MNFLTKTELIYLQSIYRLLNENGKVYSKDISKYLNIKPSSVSEMLKKLHDKKYIKHNRYEDIKLLKKGKELVAKFDDKEKIWLHFLQQHLEIDTSNAENIAKELMWIDSDLLLDRIKAFTGKKTEQQKLLSETSTATEGVVATILTNDEALLDHLQHLNIGIGTQIKVISHFTFDNSALCLIDNNREIILANEILKNIVMSIKTQ